MQRYAASQYNMSLVIIVIVIDFQLIFSQQDRQIMRETYRQVTEQLEKHPRECERLDEECNIRLNERNNKTRNTRY